MTVGGTVAVMLSQYPPKANPPTSSLDADSGIPHPVIELGDFIELPDALYGVDARHKD